MSAILCHTNISEVVSKYPPKPVTNLKLTPGKFLVSLTWEDPQDYTEEGYTCTWAKTIVVRKQGGYPNDIHDGTVVITTVERDKYKTSGYDDTGLTAGTTYYYKVFSCSTDGVYGTPAEGNGVPKSYKVMTVKINLNNSNPEKCGSYVDDAVGMNSGINANEWIDFFGIKPCYVDINKMKVYRYLNPNDYTKFEDGTDSNLSSNQTYYVMVEFPRRGLRITKSGATLTISMTNDPDDPDFQYYAHTSAQDAKQYFYLAVYPTKGNMSLSNVHIEYTSTVSVEPKSWNDGTLSICGFYQWTYLQAMYLLQFKGDFNSQKNIGYGYLGQAPLWPTGTSDDIKALSGATSNASKLFGLENPWGNATQLLNGIQIIYSSNKCNIYVTTDPTAKLYEYTNASKWTLLQTTSFVPYGYYTSCIGSSLGGFYPDQRSSGMSTANGSSTTYFCDYSIGTSSDNYMCMVGGHCGQYASEWNGMFYWSVIEQYYNDKNDLVFRYMIYL